MAAPKAVIFALGLFMLMSTGYAFAEWRELRSDELGFRVEFPNEANSRENNQEPDFFDFQKEFVVEVGDGVVALIVMRFKPGLASKNGAERIFRHFIDNYAGQCGGTVKEQALTMQIGVARSAYRQCDQAGIVKKSFFWLRDDRLYELSAGGPEADVLNPAVDRIFKSLKLLPE